MTVTASGRMSPASLLLRSKSAPAKIESTENPDQASATRDNFFTRTILAPILFLSFILSLAIVDRKRRLEEDRKHGVLTSNRRRLLYLSLFWKIPQTAKDDDHSSRKSSPDHHLGDGDSDSGRSVSRRGSGSSEHSGGHEHGHEIKMMEIKTLAEKQREARSLSAEAFEIQNRVMLGMGIFSIVFGLLCWAAYLNAKHLLGLGI